MGKDKETSVEPYYLRKAAARVLSAQENGSFDTIYRWILAETKQGTIPLYPIRKALFVRLSEVNARIEQLRQKEESDAKQERH